MGRFIQAIWCWVFLTPAIVAASPVMVEFKNALGESVGSATLTEGKNGVNVRLDLKRLPPGPRAFHVHENGSCQAPTFESAGGHFNPEERPHGFLAAKGPHAGDFENIRIGDDGTLQAELTNDRITLGDGKNSLLRKGGTALVIHEGVDDYLTQPTGDAGGRIACAEIKKPDKSRQKKEKK